RPPRKCSSVGDGSVTFGVTSATVVRNRKSSTKIPCGRSSRPVTCSEGGLSSRTPAAEWNRTASRGGTSVTLLSLGRESRCHEPRLNSPSVTRRNPSSSCSRTTSRIASCWMRLSSDAVSAPCSAARRAAMRASGRIRLPTWSARKGGVVRSDMGRLVDRQRWSWYKDFMSVQALGYLGVRADGLDDWAAYGSRLLGLQRVDKSRSSMAFRMDDRKQRIVVEASGGKGIGFFGWEVQDGAALDALAARVEQSGVTVAAGSRALADERHVQDLVVFNDPLGHRVEVFHGAETTSDPFVPGRSISGFRTGPLGLGHVVLQVESMDVLPFYRDVLGFRLSDYYFHPFTAFFLHANPRHHSIAFIQSGKNAVHHVMIELFSFDDVGQGYDLAM